MAGDVYTAIGNHRAGKDVGLANEVGNEGVCWFVVDFLRRANLLDDTVLHYHDFVRHGERLFLVVGYVNKGDAQLFVHLHKFNLHVLAHLEVQCAKGLVQKEHFWLVNQSARNCNTLLLSAGKGTNLAVAVVLEVYHFESRVNLVGNFRFGVLAHFLYQLALFVGFWFAIGDEFEFQTKCDVAKNCQVWEQCVLLENGVEVSFVWRQFGDILAVEVDVTACWLLKSGNHAQSGCFATTRWAKQCYELALFDVQRQVFYNGFVAIRLVDVFDFDDIFHGGLLKV